MTLLEDICQVHDGVLKAPPLTDHGNVLQNSFVKDIAYFTYGAPYDRERIFNDAKGMATEAVRIMQLASNNIEKERSKIKDEVIVGEYKTLNELISGYQSTPHCDNPLGIKLRTIQYIPGDDTPFKEVRALHDMSGLNDAEDARKAKAALNRLEQQDEPDYVFEVGLVLGTVRPK